MALVYLFTEWAAQFVLMKNDAALMNEQLGIEASQVNGLLQASMQVGMGAGGITLGFILAARFEKAVFVLLPFLGAMSIALIPTLGSLDPQASRWAVMLASVLAGTGFGASVPVSLSLAQRLLPHRTSLVSGMMLGGAWMLSFLGPMGAEVIQNGLASKPSVPGFVIGVVEMLPESMSSGIMDGLGLNAAFYVTAGLLAVAGIVAFFLSHSLIVRSAD